MSLPLLLLAAMVGCTSAPLAEGVRPEGRRVVLLLDASTSMRKNDPQGAAPEGAQLLLGLVGSEDSVGVLTYAAEAEVRRPLSPAGSARQGLAQALSQIPRDGITDFAEALDTARRMLAAGNAPPGSPLILLTDGVPYRGRRQHDGPVLKEVLDQIAASKWRIFAIALGEEAATPFLARIVAATGGAVFPVASADNLLEAFQEVATEALGYLRAERGGTRAEVTPHTGRLAFLARGGALEQVAREGAAAAPIRSAGNSGERGDPPPRASMQNQRARRPGADRRPRNTAPIRTKAGQFAVGLIERPEPGVWTVTAPGAEVVALVEPRFGLDFLSGKPPERARAGEQVEVAVRLVGDADAVAEVRDRLLLRAKLSLDEKPVGAPLPLKRQEGETFAVSFRAPQVERESALSLVVEAVVEDGARPYVLRRTRALTVAPGGATVPAAPLALRCSPARVEAVAWEDGPGGSFTVELVGDPEHPATVRCAGRSVELAAGAKQSLELPLRAGKLELLAFDPGQESEPRWRGEVEVVLRRYAVRGPRSLELAPVPAGVAGEPRPLGLSLAPEGTLEPGAVELTGPAGATLPLTLADGALAATPPRDLPPGDYRGELPLTVREAPGLPPRALPVRLRVLPPVQAPRAVKVRGSWGWVTTPVEVSFPAARELAVTIVPGVLRGPGAEIQPELDIRAEPLDGWNGATLGAAPRRFALRVFLAADLPAGSYAGAVKVSAAGGAELEIPVTLDVTR
ncbi:MAG: VWA domain-containing protein [Planctomycetota bacterium]